MAGIDRALAPYGYSFPKSLVAQAPASPRDGARLLVYDRATGRATTGHFHDLPKFLPPRSVIVFNQTKVIPARLTLTKETGGAVRVLFISDAGREVRVMADRQLTVGTTLKLNARTRFRVAGQEGKYYRLAALFPGAVSAVFDRHGTAPLPPYIKHSPLSRSELKKKYQTIFARERGSVAAPTASLHFTDRLLAKLERAGHEVSFVTLHVNLGTFAPLTEEQLRTGKLHEERYEISRETTTALNAAAKNGRPIIAVGTTVARTLESAADANGRLKPGRGTTDIFIREGYRFRMVKGLVTNFHVPRSSLLMLVSAFAGRDPVMRLYRRAIRERFRLFSFGDGMLLR